MKAALEFSGLAVASGLNSMNVGQFIPYADALLVSSGIESSPGEIDPKRLVHFMSAVKDSVEAERETRTLTS